MPSRNRQSAELLGRTPSKKLRPLQLLAPFLRPYRTVIILAFIALTLAASATLAVPFAVRFMIDQGFSKSEVTVIDQFFWALFAIAAVLALATAIRHYLVSWLGERVVADVRKAVYAHVMGMSPSFFETTRTGEVLSRLTTDTTLIQTVVGSTVSMALRSAFMLTGGLIMLTITSPALTGIIIVLVPLIMLPLIFFGRMVRRLSRASQDRVADTSAHAGESLNAVQVIQAFTYEKQTVQRYANSVEQAFDTARQRLKARALLTALVIMMVFSSAIFLLWLGAQAVLNNEMSAGELSQFILYAVIVASSAGILSEVWGELQRAAGATERLMELLHIQSDVQSPQTPVSLHGSLEGAVQFDNVRFHYPSRPDHAAINKLSLKIKSGETVALVGPSGAGKSTLFHLLLRFYDPQHGSLLIDGIPLQQFSLHDLRKNIGLVPQDTVIFAADAMENIRYGKPQASDEEVLHAAKLAHADQFIARLPEGYHTHLGERGVRLSGGERQRIAIARAILKNPPILLLDEATSALDAESEKEVQHALEQLSQERTTLVIAHRLSTVLKADNIIVIDNGEIIATGTHAQLIKEGGLYKQLAELQFAI
ncbi:Efflux ABC transporter, permease/ATP-binding protein [hydrothermal vent metagenome]|uniref:Efflux ABC transporter, permease/ATP-binding protein n=1 Tax=hydrothermal vent metagenome TaxID=652676 RepID=A0A3B0ZF07_9ZZZZ